MLDQKLFQMITPLVNDYSLINFVEVDKSFMFSYGNILIKSDLNLSICVAWYLDNKDNFKKIYDALSEQYKALYDKNIDKLNTYQEKQADLLTNNYIEGERKNITHNATHTNNNYVTTFESDLRDRLNTYSETPQHENYSSLKDIPNEGTTQKGEFIKSGYQNEINIIVDNETINGHKVNVSRETIKGNSGLKTPQDMIRSEIELRTKYNFIQILEKKFLEDLTLNMWGEEHDYFFFQ